MSQIKAAIVGSSIGIILGAIIAPPLVTVILMNSAVSKREYSQAEIEMMAVADDRISKSISDRIDMAWESYRKNTNGVNDD